MDGGIGNAYPEDEEGIVTHLPNSRVSVMHKVYEVRTYSRIGPHQLVRKFSVSQKLE